MITCSVSRSRDDITELSKTIFYVSTVQKRNMLPYCREGGMVKTFRQESSESQSPLLRRKFTVEGAALSTATQDSFNGEERGRTRREPS